ncbi:glutamate synthase subunit beta, partial [Novosphingobium sp. Chol11]|uniref:glutamate synthase subunit beta n=1 Tax=Novosphingobium sp. Chol11 TaxID=1385763 RepID=UPI0025E8F06D
LACAQQLARAGHSVTVFEKSDRIGGLLRYGIPDFKMEKHLINRRVMQMEVEGVQFRVNTEIGVTVSFASLQENYDAVVLSGGAENPRGLAIPGAELPGVRMAMEFLSQQNKRVAGDDEVRAAPRGSLMATGKHVLVIGGGDTGSDCVGTSNRQGALSVTQLEIMPRPPEKENKALNWPNWPLKLRTSTSHEEGVSREFAVLTKRVIGENDVTGLECVRVEWTGGQMQEVADSAFTIQADLILLAMGFVGPNPQGLLEQAGVELDARGNVKGTERDYKTSVESVFACGDMRRGQSLVVWAIREGRQCARAVDEALMGVSELPR